MKFKKLAPFLNAVKRFAMRNYLMLGYIACTVLLELTAICVTCHRFYISDPTLFLCFVAAICFCSFFIDGHKGRYVLFTVALGFHFIVDLVFVVVFDSTGTLFDYAMLNLRNDAVTILESIPFNFVYVFVSSILLAAYCAFGWLLKSKMPSPERKKSGVIAMSILLAVSIGLIPVFVYSNSSDKFDLNPEQRLYGGTSGSYSDKGIVGNAASEFGQGLWFSHVDVGDEKELENFVYAKTSEKSPLFGAARGYNTVTVLCESLEWFTFLMDETRYPNGYAKQINSIGKTELSAALRKLYPNLYKLYNDKSVALLENSYSLEKTDISENKAIIGNYPLYEYINYAYPENSLPYSLPNLLKSLYGVESRSYHNGYRTFYNRAEHHTNALGFKSFTPSEDMDVAHGGWLGERNLDSEMIECCKAQMFPADKRFNTFITTITQHGQYAYRTSLESYYKQMDELGILPETGDADGDALRYYCAAGMDLDKAIGIMLDYLDEQGLADNTLIVLYGDHNAYYQGISNYVKNIYGTSHERYVELYRIPVIVKVGNKDIKNPHIQKFTCVDDIYPTILDLLGITGFSNLIYGKSAFSDTSSVLYSRAYDKFITDKLYFGSINKILYEAKDAPEDKSQVESACLELLDKISHCNRLFAADFFKTREADFYERLKAVQSI